MSYFSRDGRLIEHGGIIPDGVRKPQLTFEYLRVFFADAKWLGNLRNSILPEDPLWVAVHQLIE